MKSFEECFSESSIKVEYKEACKRGWDVAQIDFDTNGVPSWLKGIDAFCMGYNAHMHMLVAEATKEPSPLELHIRKMITATEENLMKFSRLSGSEDIINLLQLELECYKLALKQHTSGKN